MSVFNKEERVAFDEALEGFQDALVMSELVSTYNTDQTMMERANDVIWRPMPYVLPSFTGEDQTANFLNITQLSVPASITTQRSVPWQMTIRELRDGLQEKRIKDAATQVISSQINLALLNSACFGGTVFVKRTAAASGFDDIATADAAFNEIGVTMETGSRYIALATRDYNSMAGNLAARQNVVGKVQTAYDRAYIGPIAGFDAFKMDYSLRLAAAVPGAGVTVNGANQRYVPRATSTAGTGETANVDNRFQNLTITVGAGGALKVGDAFTIANVNSVHMITKQDTGQLKTFRITAIVSGGGTAGTNVVTISPPIIAADSSPTTAETQYKNVTVTPANGAVITFLNTAAGSMNPFWSKDAIEILPGRLPVPTDSGVGVMRGTTDNGFELVMTKWFTGENYRPRYRLDTLFGTVNKQPEMSGIMMFSQP